MLRACIDICVRILNPFLPRKVKEGLPKRVRLVERLGGKELVHCLESANNCAIHMHAKFCLREVKGMVNVDD